MNFYFWKVWTKDPLRLSEKTRVFKDIQEGDIQEGASTPGLGRKIFWDDLLQRGYSLQNSREDHSFWKGSRDDSSQIVGTKWPLPKVMPQKYNSRRDELP